MRRERSGSGSGETNVEHSQERDEAGVNRVLMTRERRA